MYDEILHLTLRKYRGVHTGAKRSTSVCWRKQRTICSVVRLYRPQARTRSEVYRESDLATMIQAEEIKNFPACSLSRDCECRQDSDWKFMEMQHRGFLPRCSGSIIKRDADRVTSDNNCGYRQAHPRATCFHKLHLAQCSSRDYFRRIQVLVQHPSKSLPLAR